MKARSKELLDRAVAAMVSAIEIYNKPDFPYRGESFTILATNAWELLVKAKWLASHNNRLSSLYVRQSGGRKRNRIKKTQAGNAMTYSLSYLAIKLLEVGALDKSAFGNLRILEELRDSAIHFYHPSAAFAERLQEIAMAAVRNFNTAARDWFGEDLSRFNFYLMPLSFASPLVSGEAVAATWAMRRFLKFVSDQEHQDTDPSSPYTVAVNIELRFVRSKAGTATPVRVTDDPLAPAVRLTEERIRDSYRWDYDTLTQRCRERYDGFKVDQDYHKVRKQFDSDARYVHIRALDPGNPKSQTKRFYNPAILQELDKVYRRKS